MEIAKFVFACISVSLSLGGVFWKVFSSYSKHQQKKIEEVRQAGQKEIEEVKQSALETIKAEQRLNEREREHLTKKVDTLEGDIKELRKTVNDDIRDRLSNIEGSIKSMGNILRSIQDWFITNTPSGK